MQGKARLRSDTARTRDRLLDAVGELLEERGLGFSLPDLARTSGVATATVYRHFADIADVRRAFYRRLIDQLVAEVEGVSGDSRTRFEQVGTRWVNRAVRWGRAATHIRSPEGFLERVHGLQAPESALNSCLVPVVEALIADGVIPEQDVDYAVLLWITLFDERVIIDLRELSWAPDRIAAALSGSLLAAWQAA